MKTILVDSDAYHIFQEMQNLLDTYKTRKIILTNADDDGFKKYGLDKMPYEVFTLKHNPEKTDPKYFKLMLKHFSLSKDDVIYFEHNPEAVRSAQLVGITSFHYDADKKDLDSLKSFLDKNIEYLPFQKRNYLAAQKNLHQNPNIEKHPTWRTNNFTAPRQNY